MGLTSQAAAGVKWTTLASVVTACTEAIRAVVLARFLYPLDFGLMAMASVVIGIGQTYADLGVSAAIIHRQDSTKEQLSSLYWMNILSGVTIFGAIWLSSPWIGVLFREPRVVPLLRAVALVFIIAPLASQFDILLQKELQFNALAKFDILASLSSAVVAVTCVVWGLGVWALVCGFLTNISLKTLLLLRIGWTRFRPSLHFRRSDLKGYVAFGLFQMGERSINRLAERLDQLLIGPLLGAQALGYYNFAFNLTAQPIGRINPILTRVAFPVFSKIQHDTDRLQRGYLRLIRLLTTINAPLLIGLAVVAPLAVPSIFGGRWSPSILLIQILCAVSLSRSTGNPIGSLQLAKGRADLGFWWNIILFVLNATMVYFGAKLGQAKGVAVALLLVQLLLAVPTYFCMVRPLVGKCSLDYAAAVLKPVSAACIMGAALACAYLWDTRMPPAVQLIAQIAVGALLYISLLQVLHKEVLQEFRSLILSRLPTSQRAA